MEFQSIVFICVLALCVLTILIYLLILRHSIREVAAELVEKLRTDTNTLISISIGDSSVQQLASRINRQLQALRKERLKLQTGNDELTTAVTNISHDLSTPLTAICGYLDLLEQEPQSEKSGRYLAVIRERTDAMRSLTEELFCYSVITTTTDELRMENVCLNDILEQRLVGFTAHCPHAASHRRSECRRPRLYGSWMLPRCAEFLTIFSAMPSNILAAIWRSACCRMAQSLFPIALHRSVGCRQSACSTVFTPWRRHAILPALGCLSQSY